MNNITRYLNTSGARPGIRCNSLFDILKSSYLLLTLALLILIPDSKGQGFLKAQGQKIVNEKGDEVILRGVGLGGWMLQEGYMLKLSEVANPQHQIRGKIEALIGKEKTETFYNAWLENHTRKIDIDSMAAWGFNSVRLPMHYNLFTPAIGQEPVAGNITWINKGFEMTDKLLEWCKANNMYLILDLHATPGGQGNDAAISDYDSSKPSLWESEQNQKKIIALWKKLAERYANEPYIGGYDIINEPNWGFSNPTGDKNGCAEQQNALLWDLQKKITEAIREVDKKHIVIIEGNCWGNNYSGLPQLWDNNIVLSFHKYWNYNDQGSIQGIMSLRSSRNVPVWLGESGENSNTWFTNAINLVETNKIGWAWWPLKKLGMSCPLEVPTTKEYEQIISYWKGNAPKPSEELAFQALMKIADNLKLENNIYHKDVVDAMMRQPHTREVLPYVNHTISASAPARIFATHYDLGRNGVAYFDKDTANYRTSTNTYQAWNQGWGFRNDGVDIETCTDQNTNGYNIGWIETGEWMQYTVHVADEGMYSIGVRTAATNANAKISLRSNGVKVTPTITLPNTGGNQIWGTTEVKDVYLKKGINKIRVTIENGGFNFNYLEFTRQSKASAKPKLMEGMIRHNEKEINLTYNQPFETIPQAHGFVVKVNDVEVVTETVNLQEGLAQLITITLQNEVSYGDKVTVSYSGSIASQAGETLEAFNDQLITVLFDKKVSKIPGTVRAEDFAVNNGFSLENSSDLGGGQNVGFTDARDYLDFMVMVEEEGNYIIDYRIASESAGGKLKVQSVKGDDTVKDLSNVTFNATGGWQKWSTVTGTQAQLEKGFQTIRLYAETSSFNINWVKFTFNPTPTATNNEVRQAQIVVFPNPSNGTVILKYPSIAGNANPFTIRDTVGKTVYSSELDARASEMKINMGLAKGLYTLVLENEGSPITKKVIVE